VSNPSRRGSLRHFNRTWFGPAGKTQPLESIEIPRPRLGHSGFRPIFKDAALAAPASNGRIQASCHIRGVPTIHCSTLHHLRQFPGFSSTFPGSHAQYLIAGAFFLISCHAGSIFVRPSDLCAPSAPESISLTQTVPLNTYSYLPMTGRPSANHQPVCGSPKLD
jgi:hypothetical protein